MIRVRVQFRVSKVGCRRSSLRREEPWIGAGGLFRGRRNNRSRGARLHDILVPETRSLLSEEMAANVKRVTAAVMPVTAASGPPIRIPSTRVGRRRLPALAKDHSPSNMEAHKRRAQQISRTSRRRLKNLAAWSGCSSGLEISPGWPAPDIPGNPGSQRR